MPDTRILLVDDVELIPYLESAVARRYGCTIIKARGGAEALRMVRSQKPDLVVLDLAMPDLPGDDVCRLLKTFPGTASIPVVIVVSRGDRGQLERCKAAGCDGFLTKPVDPSALLVLAERLMGIRQRAAGRVHGDLECTLLLGDSACGGRIRTLSRQGAFVEVSLPLTPGRTMEITFCLPGAETPLRLRAVVRWSGKLGDVGPAGVGVEFKAVPPETARALKSFEEEG